MRKFPFAILVACLALLSLSACSWVDSVLSPNPNVVATLESSLAATDSLALAYVQLPKCGSKAANGSSICSDPAIVKDIGTAASAAYIAVKAAEANETASSIQAAQNLVSAFQQIIPSINK